MALDLNCRECQAGLTQVLQSALGFTCFDHGRIGIEITEIMKIATAPLEDRIKELEDRIKGIVDWECSDCRAPLKTIAEYEAHSCQ